MNSTHTYIHTRIAIAWSPTLAITKCYVTSVFENYLVLSILRASMSWILIRFFFFCSVQLFTSIDIPEWLVAFIAFWISLTVISPLTKQQWINGILFSIWWKSLLERPLCHRLRFRVLGQFQFECARQSINLNVWFVVEWCKFSFSQMCAILYCLHWMIRFIQFVYRVVLTRFWFESICLDSMFQNNWFLAIYKTNYSVAELAHTRDQKSDSFSVADIWWRFSVIVNNEPSSKFQHFKLFDPTDVEQIINAF